jgi:hypothetical protein
VANLLEPPTGYSAAVQVIKTTASDAWGSAFNVNNGATGVAFAAGTVAASTNPSNSQLSTWNSRTAGGSTLTASQFLDSDGVFWMRAPGAGAGSIALDPGGAGSATAVLTPSFFILGKPIRNVSYTFGTLPAMQNGDQVYCSDCAVTSGASNVCAGGGTGAFVFVVNSIARCFDAQN